MRSMMLGNTVEGNSSVPANPTASGCTDEANTFCASFHSLLVPGHEILLSAARFRDEGPRESAAVHAIRDVTSITVLPRCAKLSERLRRRLIPLGRVRHATPGTAPNHGGTRCHCGISIPHPGLRPGSGRVVGALLLRRRRV